MGLSYINSELLPPKMRGQGWDLSGDDREMAPWGVINEHVKVFTLAAAACPVGTLEEAGWGAGGAGGLKAARQSAGRGGEEEVPADSPEPPFWYYHRQYSFV